VQITRSVTDALRSIDGYYSIVYWYDGHDAADHWKVYAPSVPGYVNDLSTLRFTKVVLDQSDAIDHAQPVRGLTSGRTLAIQSPPATYYGQVLQAPTSRRSQACRLLPRSMVTCADKASRRMGGQIVYSLNVVADGPGGSSGCGAGSRN
jgi:hypothetical protein